MPKILIIDDDPDMRALLQETLAGAGHQIFTAADGNEALNIQRRTPVHLVITDIFMPGKEGLHTIQDFRADFPNVPIIAMSGRSEYSSEALSIAKQMGARNIFRKPFKLDDMVAAVWEIFATSPRRPEPPALLPSTGNFKTKSADRNFRAS